MVFFVCLKICFINIKNVFTMSLTNQIPEKINFLKANQREDVASLSIVANKNFTKLTNFLNSLVDSNSEMLEIIELLQNNQENQKILFTVPESMLSEDNININDFLLTKYINNSVNNYQFMIVDLNTQRETNFLKKSVTIFDNENKLLQNSYSVYQTETTIMVFVPFDTLPTDNHSVKIVIS